MSITAVENRFSRSNAKAPAMSRYFFMLLVSLLWTAGFAHAATDPFKTSSVVTKDEFLPFEQAYVLDAQFVNDALTLHWQIKDGYYLYRHQFAFKTENGAAVPADIPAGKSKEDEYFGHVEVYYHAIDIVVKPASAQTFTLGVTAQGCADAGLCYPPATVYFRVDPAAKSVTPTAAPVAKSIAAAKLNVPAAESSLRQWLGILLFAALGGSILNLMPCVFPVLSLKALSFAAHRDQRQGLHGLVYTFGVILSFVLVAGVLLLLKAAGQAIGWGFQLQQPWFVGGLTYLFFAMGLSLSGFWELGGSWMGFGDKLATRGGYSGSFFTGVLATLVASPCTAPFMGSALGFAATQPPLQSLSIFAALGFGMALPMLLLSLSPRLLAYIPKPGAWMDRFKQALAFPLYATAIWLCWIVGRQTGSSGMAVILGGTLAITLALWLWRFGIIARAFAAASLAFALAVLGSPLLLAGQQSLTTAPADKAWQPYRAETLAQLRAAGKPVFLNVTADWCITCLTNEKVALGTDSVKQAFQQHGVTYLKADWTNYDPAITALLAEFGRNGIPLYVLFPSDPKAEPVVLPQLLSPTRVIEAVAAAAPKS
ncbi:MAG: disulfide bond formation protein DsbD [Verrucomicrobiaceae bacterium]|nr:disulfide bond formation protein DsbD [Verrucomicrobiaceae bacterium]